MKLYKQFLRVPDTKTINKTHFEEETMSFAYGLLQIVPTIAENREEKQKRAMQADFMQVVDREMGAFCERKAAEYGITRGMNLIELQVSITRDQCCCEELLMKNEEARPFLEKEREELMARRDAMFDRLQRLPVEGEFALDRSEVRIGRRECRTSTADGRNALLSKAEKYLENSVLDFPTEEYLQRAYNSISNIIGEMDKDIAIQQKGVSGEKEVNEQLRLYEGKYRILQNIVLESADSQGNTSEVDVYIITDRGLVVVEVKNYGNENQRLHITNDGRWVMEDIHNGNILRRIDSPVEQNTRHCLAVERLLAQELGEDCHIPVIPVIFIANNKVSIHNESRSSVIRVSEFYTFINSVQGTDTLSGEMQEKIENLLKEHNIGARDFPVKSRRRMVGLLEEVEAVFTNYVLYNNEVAEEYQKAIIRNTPVYEKKKRKWKKPSTMTIILCLLPYLPILLFDWTPEFRMVLLAGYTMMLFNIPVGLFAAVLLFFILIL